MIGINAVLVAALVALAVRLRSRTPRSARASDSDDLLNAAGGCGEMRGRAGGSGSVSGGARGGHVGHVYGSMPVADDDSPL